MKPRNAGHRKAAEGETHAFVARDLACGTGAIFLRFQASKGKREVSEKRESRGTGWTPNPVARDSLSPLTSCFGFAFAFTCKTQIYNACSAGYA